MAMIFCTYCGRSFSRSEHLHRHILTHTKVRPFECSICHVSFSRRDLAQKHTAIHRRTETESNDGVLPIENRIAIACENCAKSKIRCDRQFPCMRCRSKSLKCVPRNPRWSKTSMLAPEIIFTPQHPGTESIAETLETTSLDNSSSSSDYAAQEVAQLPSPDLSWSSGSSFAGPEAPPSEDFSIQDTTVPCTMFFDTLEHDNTIYPMTGDMNWVIPSLSLSISNQVSSSLDMLIENSLTTITPSMMKSPDLGSGVRDALQLFPANPKVSLRFPDTQNILGNCTVDPTLLPIDLDSWPLFQCTPSQQSCARSRGKEHILRLEELSADEGPWGRFGRKWTEQIFEPGEQPKNVPLEETTREQISAMMQSLLHISLGWHSLSASSPPSYVRDRNCVLNLVLLPPANAVHCYLENFLEFFEPFYSPIPARSLDPNKLIATNDLKSATVLMLLMIAYGALRDQTSKAQYLSFGFLEICRTSITSMIEENTDESCNTLSLYSGLLFTVQAAWCGDSWLMDRGVSQRRMYTTLMNKLKSHGIRCGSNTHPYADGWSENSWKSWIASETINRLAYSWVMVDQEISLFYDDQLSYGISDFERPIPEDDGMWLSADTSDWKQYLDQAKDKQMPSNEFFPPPQKSLCEMFQLFLDNELGTAYILQPVHLRLLLYPLHALVSQLSQLLYRYLDNGQSAGFSKTTTKASSLLRFEEVRFLLQRWWTLAERFPEANTRQNAMINTSRILYHLVSLNLWTSFKNIEAFARGEFSDYRHENFTSLENHWMRSPQDVHFHCGQVLRLVREMSLESRPMWWPAAVYRVAIILWTHSFTALLVKGRRMNVSDIDDEYYPILIDNWSPNHAELQRYLRYMQGKPYLTMTNGERVSLSCPKMVLAVCIDILNVEATMTKLSCGVKIKLEALAEAWGSFE